jgi:ketosteroid isomerase-like protein
MDPTWSGISPLIGPFRRNLRSTWSRTKTGLRVLRTSAPTYRGHQGVRELLRETDETLAEIHAEFADVRDLGDQIVAVGKLRVRGKASGAVSESEVGYVADYRRGKATRIRTYLDPTEALEAAGLSE